MAVSQGSARSGGREVAERFTDARVPDPGVRVLFAKQYRWQCWLDVEAALAAAEAECGVIPAATAPGGPGHGAH